MGMHVVGREAPETMTLRALSLPGPAALVLICLPVICAAAAPDRSTIPIADRSAMSVFSEPLPAQTREPVLPRYDFSTDRRTERLVTTERHPVREIRITGISAIDNATVAAVTREYEGRSLSFEEMVALRDRLTTLYVERGYVTSGTVLESLEDGVLHLSAIEGLLQEIRVQSTGHFRSRYVADYLEGFGEAAPVNVLDLEERLQIFQQAPQVDVIEAQLLPGTQRGESVLWISPLETDRWAWGVEVSNQLSPAIGGVQAVGSVTVGNLTGRADDLRFAARGAEGLVEFMGEYDLPLGPRGRRLSIYAFGADSDIVREPFEHLDIGADSLTVGTLMRQPIQRSLETETNFLLSAEWRRSRTYLLGQGFSFVEGPQEGVAKLAILRTGIEALRRTGRDVIYGRAEFSAGLDALGATRAVDPSVRDGRFVKVRGQFQWVRRLNWLDSQALLRVDGQLANDPLFGLEQYPIGGRWTVRGYRENTLIRDNAVVASIEWRLPLKQSPSGRSQLEVRPFADWSRSSNVNDDEIGPRTLASVGLGVYWSPLEALQMEVYWGETLKDVDYAGEHDIQDDGIHFRFHWGGSR